MNLLRRLAVFCLLVTLSVFSGGWVYYSTPRAPDGEYTGTISGAYQVSVSFKPGNAYDIAEQTAASYRAEGWAPNPASTHNFRLFTNGTRIAAFLAENIPSGVRLTEFKRNQ